MAGAMAASPRQKETRLLDALVIPSGLIRSGLIPFRPLTTGGIIARCGELTYLSIAITITDLAKSGKLVPHEPTVPRDPHPQGPRSLWLTPDTRDWCFPAGAHPDARIRDEALANLATQMNAFALGEFMEYGIDIKRLCPKERDVWEIRSLLMKQQLRIFGWFVLPKLFVAVHQSVRSDLEKTRGQKWDQAINTAAEIRTMLVGSVAWYHDDPGAYLQNPR